MNEARSASTDAVAGRCRPYPEYRETGVPWLPRIPAHWKLRRLKTMASVRLSNVDKKTVEGEVPVRLCNYTDVYYNERITAGLDFMEATATPAQVRTFGLRRGDVIITKDSEEWTDIAVPAYVTEDLSGVLCGYHLALLRPQPEIVDGRFVARACSAVGPRDQFQIAANGITRFGLSGDAVTTAVFGIPTLEEQEAIVTFLDEYTRRIDSLVAEKERHIQLLIEERSALVHEVVTTGLDRNAPTKESGVEWLGRIPAHWQVKRLWHLTPSARPIMYGIVLPGPNVEDGVPIVKGGDVAAGRLRLDRLHRTSTEIEAGHARSRLKAGDLVYAIRGSIGEADIVPAELDGANLTQDAARVAYTDATHGRWLLYVLQSRAVFSQLDAGALGATIRGVNIRDLKRALIPVPPRPEQAKLAEHLDRQTSRIGRLIATVKDGIARLQELRSSLVACAVTGMIDLRRRTG